MITGPRLRGGAPPAPPGGRRSRAVERAGPGRGRPYWPGYWPDGTGRGTGPTGTLERRAPRTALGRARGAVAAGTRNRRSRGCGAGSDGGSVGDHGCSPTGAADPAAGERSSVHEAPSHHRAAGWRRPGSGYHPGGCSGHSPGHPRPSRERRRSRRGRMAQPYARRIDLSAPLPSPGGDRAGGVAAEVVVEADDDAPSPAPRRRRRRAIALLAGAEYPGAGGDGGGRPVLAVVRPADRRRAGPGRRHRHVRRAGDRFEQVVALADAGYADVVVLSDPTARSTATYARVVLPQRRHPPRVPLSDYEAICFDPEPQTTRGEAQFVADLARERGWAGRPGDERRPGDPRPHVARALLGRRRGDRGGPQRPGPLRIAYEWGAMARAIVQRRDC